MAVQNVLVELPAIIFILLCLLEKEQLANLMILEMTRLFVHVTFTHTNVF